jgi:hypothetical protein
MEGINDTENGGQIEEGANLRTHNKQTKSVKRGESDDSPIDLQATFLSFLEKFGGQNGEEIGKYGKRKRTYGKVGGENG